MTIQTSQDLTKIADITGIVPAILVEDERKELSPNGESFYRIAGVPERHRDFRPSDNKSDRWKKIYDRSKEIISDGCMIALVGNRGNGKTQMAACLVGHVSYNLGKKSLYTKAFDFFLSIRDSMKNDNDSELSALRKYIDPFFLVIDAYEVRSDSDFENRMIDHLLDKRYDACKSTLIISNDTEKVFAEKVGASIIDRIRETGGICNCNWESFRMKAVAA